MEKEATYHYGEIRIKDIILSLVKNLHIIVMAALICGLSAFIVTQKWIDPVYESSTSLYIINQQEVGILTTGDLSSAEQIKQDAQHLITSRTVLSEVIASLGLDMSTEELAGNITVTSPDETRFIDITVRSENPALAQKLANATAAAARDYILDSMEVTSVEIMDEAEYPTGVSSPDIWNNVIMAAIYGGIFVVIILVVAVLMDDSIKNEEDIRRNFGISVLGVIPYQKKQRS